MVKLERKRVDESYPELVNILWTVQLITSATLLERFNNLVNLYRDLIQTSEAIKYSI